MGQAASCLRLMMMMMMSWGGDDTVGVTLVDGVEAGLVLERGGKGVGVFSVTPPGPTHTKFDTSVQILYTVLHICIHFQIELSEYVETSSQQV